MIESVLRNIEKVVLKNVKFYVYLCVCTSLWRSDDGARFFGARVIGSLEPCDMGAGNQPLEEQKVL